MQYEAATLRKLQLTELEILKVVDAFCREHRVTYFLDSGTALGAMRHEGFIPWDDDVDVGMLRPDYERFLTLAADGLPEGFSLHTFENTRGYAGFFAKIYKDGTAFDTDETLDAGCEQGIFIDIFPYDQVSDDGGERNRQLKSAHFWQMVSYLYHTRRVVLPGGGIKRAILEMGCSVAHKGIRTFMSRDAIKKKFEAAKQPRRGISAKYQCFVYPLPRDVAKETLVPPVERAFEGCLLYCPAQTEVYLEAMYGLTWMELPPESGRKNHAPVNLSFGDD